MKLVEHKRMKVWLTKHFKTKGFGLVSSTVSYLGHKVDVGSLNDKLFVECGDTEPKKVFDFLKNNVNIGLLQYNSEDILWFIFLPEFELFAKEGAET